MKIYAALDTELTTYEGSITIEDRVIHSATLQVEPRIVYEASLTPESFVGLSTPASIFHDTTRNPVSVSLPFTALGTLPRIRSQVYISTLHNGTPVYNLAVTYSNINPASENISAVAYAIIMSNAWRDRPDNFVQSTFVGITRKLSDYLVRRLYITFTNLTESQSGNSAVKLVSAGKRTFMEYRDPIVSNTGNVIQKKRLFSNRPRTDIYVLGELLVLPYLHGFTNTSHFVLVKITRSNGLTEYEPRTQYNGFVSGQIYHYIFRYTDEDITKIEIAFGADPYGDVYSSLFVDWYTFEVVKSRYKARTLIYLNEHGVYESIVFTGRRDHDFSAKTDPVAITLPIQQYEERAGAYISDMPDTERTIEQHSGHLSPDRVSYLPSLLDSPLIYDVVDPSEMSIGLYQEQIKTGSFNASLIRCVITKASVSPNTDTLNQKERKAVLTIKHLV